MIAWVYIFARGVCCCNTLAILALPMGKNSFMVIPAQLVKISQPTATFGMENQTHLGQMANGRKTMSHRRRLFTVVEEAYAAGSQTEFFNECQRLAAEAS
ncbi:hypothetical protein FRC08_018465 [Ceratobasidium sp. 394]|nr:hypothetical protein FRC08_018465 [Ceratobasidium sp. 394]KAG9088711.1 hypothetical protein FS749_001949 [Ceratobasidium sp. UAMH 11750]